MTNPANPSRTAGVKALLFDTFGTLVDWRTSLIADLSEFGRARGITADWAAFVDSWRGAYAPSMDRVRKGELPWTVLDDLHRASLEKLLAEHRITGLSETELDHLNRGWHRLHPWADTVAGLQRLRTRYILGPLSNGNVALLANLARFGSLPFDMIFGADLFRHFKPDPETYLGACALLRLAPAEVMMVAAHNYDLRSAAALGMKTGFIPRPTTFQKTWDKNPAIEQLMKEPQNNAIWEIMNCSLWLPCQFQFGIGMKDPSGSPIRCGSVDMLWTALQQLNEANWNASPERIAEWRRIELSDDMTFDRQAQLGFSGFFTMCRIARERRLPLKLHY